jgi:uncharacterized protein (TIGR02265 family)
MFEALFDRRLKPEGAFREALLGAGYDANKPKAKYPTSVWVTCLEIARSARYSSLGADEAYRILGREFTEGFMQTLVGRLVGVALPIMRPRSFLARLERYFKMGREGGDIRYDMTEPSPGVAHIEVVNPAGVPGAFVAGMIDVAFGRLAKSWTIGITQRTAIHYALDVRWEDKD